MPKVVRNVWDRGERDKRPPTKRCNTMNVLRNKKLLTLEESCEYLRVTKRVLNALIKKGVVELVPGSTNLVSMKTLVGLIMPVRSLNKRLQYLEELKSDINKKIDKINESNRN